MKREKSLWIALSMAVVFSLIAGSAEALPIREATKKTVVELWSTEGEEYRIQAYEKVADHFMSANPDVDVRIVPIDEAITTLLTAAARSKPPSRDRAGRGRRVAPYLADGILDVDAATRVIKELGEATFPKGVLDLVRTRNGRYAAIPFDGMDPGALVSRG